MAIPTRWTWVWATSGSWCWTGKPGLLQSMWSHDWETELNWQTSFSHTTNKITRQVEAAEINTILILIGQFFNILLKLFSISMQSVSTVQWLFWRNGKKNSKIYMYSQLTPNIRINLGKEQNWKTYFVNSNTTKIK